MNPIVHGELSWLGAQGLSERRDRLLVTMAGLAPDLDGLSIVAGEDAYAKWHHLISHGVVAAVVVSLAASVFARRRLAVGLLALGAFHLHLLCDLLGSGPGWPIFYLEPFSSAPLAWDGSWNLASWQNGVIGLIATALVLACAVRFSRTIVEVFSLRADRAVVETLRRRFKR